MAKGRGNSAILAIMLLMCMLVFHFEITHATTFKVGDAGGWTFAVSNWPSGKTFKAGDILEFKYDPAVHNFAIVNAADYNSGTTSTLKVFNSGHEKITLRKGPHYFICTVPGHWERGMKIKLNVE